MTRIPQIERTDLYVRTTALRGFGRIKPDAKMAASTPIWIPTCTWLPTSQTRVRMEANGTTFSFRGFAGQEVSTTDNNQKGETVNGSLNT